MTAVTKTKSTGPAVSRTVAAPAPANANDKRATLPRQLDGVVHILTCGSVDDGKSTLIGRLLWDASDLPEDTRATLQRSAGADGQPDLSLLVDGLVAEREQGITIDIAWRYFDTAQRRYVIIDSPGHEQYTRNMASGASHADVAVMLVDARDGVKKQTRRHAAILDLLGVRRVILAVNKMDLVNWSQAQFEAIEADFRGVTAKFLGVNAYEFQDEDHLLQEQLVDLADSTGSKIDSDGDGARDDTAVLSGSWDWPATSVIVAAIWDLARA